MKSLPYLLAAAILVSGCHAAEPTEKTTSQGTAQVKEVKWQTDFENAKKDAVAKGRPILANFSGSDWCGWCKRLDEEVFSKEAFKSFADKNLVLFVADFPAHKEQSADLKKQNEALAETYQVRGFPTILLLDANGSVLAKTGYRRGGPDPYVEHLKELIKTSTPKPNASPR